MAFTKLRMDNPNTGDSREAPVGFSWTVAFFGAWPALFRKDYKNFFIMIVLQMLTMNLSNFYYMFSYNKNFIQHLINEGYEAVPTPAQNIKEISLKIGMDIPVLEKISNQ